MKEKNFETKKVYIILSLITLISATLALLISNGKLFQILFFIDPDDTGMDFFNSLIEVHTRKPYEQFGVIYPPLANLFFYVLCLFVPDSLKESWPASHDDSKLIVGTHEDVRLLQSTMVLFLMFLIITLFMIAVMIHSYTKSYLLTFCLLFSAGTLQAIERGNVILIAFLLTLYFVKHYQDENKLTSELALIALAGAFGLKLYPCVFGLLLLKEHKWAASARAILYAVLVTILPTFVFEGPGAILSWLNHVFDFGGFSGGDTADPSAVGNLNNIPIHGIIAFVLLITVVASFYLKKNNNPIINLTRNQTLFLLTYLSLIVGGGACDYNLIFFLIPFLYFIKEEMILNRNNCTEFIVYLICLLPFGINQITIPIFTIYLLGCGCHILKKHSSCHDH